MPLTPLPDTDGVDLSPSVSDEVKTTTCYMCACRCGINVHMKDGQIRYIQGNRNHPVNKGVLCGKGSAGIMTQMSPAKLTKPLKRSGPRGSGEFEEIEWDEALALATDWLSAIRKDDPKKLAFFTGRDQSQSFTGWWAQQFGTINYAAHGGFCSVNMAAGGLYTFGGSFWEFGEPDWEHAEYFMLFGVAEDHDSNPIKMGLGTLKERGAKVISVNPARTGYSAIADEWIGIKPGTDGVFILALVHELLKAGKVDLPYLVRYTNAPWLVIDAPGTAEDGLIARDEDGNPLCWDHAAAAARDATKTEVQPALQGSFEWQGKSVRPVFQLILDRYLSDDYAPARAAEISGVPEADIRRIAAELAHTAFEKEITLDIPWTDWAGRKHETMTGRPVAMHAMRGISAHSNGFQTCRSLHLLQILLGTIDVPGGFRYKAPYPKPVPNPQKPGGKFGTAPNQPLDGPHLGFPQSPDDLLLDEGGKALRIDKGFSWDAPMSAHGLMHMVITNAWAGDPYPVDTLFLYMANMGWNSSMNPGRVHDMLTDVDEKTGEYRIPHIIYSDAFHSETIAYADLVLPDTTYLERHDCISLLDRPIGTADAAGDAIRQPIVEPDRDVRPFQTVLLDLGARLGLPEMVNEDGSPIYPGGYPDYMVNHERKPGIGPLSGWRGEDGTSQGTGAPNPNQLASYVENGCFWEGPVPEDARYYKMANQSYLQWATDMGFLPNPEQIIFHLYSEPVQTFRLAAQGHGDRQPPDHLRARVEESFDPLPTWWPPFEHQQTDAQEYPLSALTQRPMHHYHSWGTMNAWLRQITNQNRLFVHPTTAAETGVGDDGWVWISSPHGRVKAQIKLVDGVEPGTVWTWNAIGKRRGAWGLDKDAEEFRKGFLLNHVISELLPGQDEHGLSNSDPVTGQAAWFDLKVRIDACLPEEAGETEPMWEASANLDGQASSPHRVQYGKGFRTNREAAE